MVIKNNYVIPREIRERIRSFSWDRTVGAGIDPNECGWKEFEAALPALRKRPGVEVLSQDEHHFFYRCWSDKLAELANP